MEIGGNESSPDDTMNYYLGISPNMLQEHEPVSSGRRLRAMTQNHDEILMTSAFDCRNVKAVSGD